VKKYLTPKKLLVKWLVLESLSCRKLFWLSSDIMLWLLKFVVKTGNISKEIQMSTI